jgi:hypothetical protein
MILFIALNPFTSAYIYPSPQLTFFSANSDSSNTGFTVFRVILSAWDKDLLPQLTLFEKVQTFKGSKIKYSTGVDIEKNRTGNKCIWGWLADMLVMGILGLILKWLKYFHD